MKTIIIVIVIVIIIIIIIIIIELGVAWMKIQQFELKTFKTPQITNFAFFVKSVKKIYFE